MRGPAGCGVESSINQMKSISTMKHIIRTLHRFTALILFTVILAFAGSPAFATDLNYTTLPQTGDSDLVRTNKVQAVQTAASNLYTNITTAATTTVKTGSGVIERITVNTGGASSIWVAYDNTAGSGTKIATGSSATQTTLTYNCRFATGLTIVTSTGTPADITVVYR